MKRPPLSPASVCFHFDLIQDRKTGLVIIPMISVCRGPEKKRHGLIYRFVYNEGMDRYRKLLPINQIVENMAKSRRHPAIAKAHLRELPEMVFGRVIASHIDRVAVDGDRLILVVLDDLWRRELRRQRKNLLNKVKSAHPTVRKIEIVGSAEPTTTRQPKG